MIFFLALFSSGSFYDGPNKRFSRRVNLQSYRLQFGYRNSLSEKSTGFYEGFLSTPSLTQALDQSSPGISNNNKADYTLSKLNVLSTDANR